MNPIIDNDSGINVTIHIACGDEQEVYDHLDVLREQFQKAFKKDPDFARKTFADSNCYGTHNAVIVQDV